ncbi:MAG TPA: zf-HC2 domain-containing protein, partial [Blastocatellia bacterium]|nr:zf-HC2 domain-containing protein [Blastocatellia bacterium]
RYVMHRLNAEERRAFQEHLFACEECFEQTQTSAQFIAGVRHSSRVGVLSERALISANSKADSWLMNWFKPALTFAVASAAIMAIVLGWVVFNQIPKLKEQVASEQRSRDQALEETLRTLEQTRRELEAEREQAAKERIEREKLQSRLDEIAHNRVPRSDGSIAESQTDLPIVLLEAQRDAKPESNQLRLNRNAQSAILWIEVEMGNRFKTYDLELFSANNKKVASVAGAKPNSYGAVAVSIPARNLSAGKYVVKAYGLNDGQRELAGEYDLVIRK